MIDERFDGVDPRECGEHRTLGARAWCYDCNQYCSPVSPCNGCELPGLRADRDEVSAGPITLPTCCGADIYWCPSVGQFECPTHGGFNTCCDRPQHHTPIGDFEVQARALLRWVQGVDERERIVHEDPELRASLERGMAQAAAGQLESRGDFAQYLDSAHAVEACARCGRDPAAGYAFIGDRRYCHGDEERPSCYERTNFSDAFETNEETT